MKDIYCLTDKEKICNMCVIKGTHKDHEYEMLEELQAKNQAKLKEIK